MNASAEPKDPEDTSGVNADSGSSPQALSRKAHFASPVLSQVLPPRIQFLCKPLLLFPAPALQLFLTADCRVDVTEALVVDEAMDFVLFGETLNGINLVLENATVEKTGDAHVERAGSAGEDVDPVSVVSAVAHGEMVTRRVS